MFTASDAISSMNHAQHMSMVQGMMPSNVAAEQLSGGLLSRGAAIGAPALAGAAGLLGLDPLSMGLKAGTMAYGRMGLGLAGAAGIGMGVAGGVGIAALGAQYAGGQMMHGAQQQMMLNQGMRMNYNFMNAQGGMGFTTTQGNQIGSQLRHMSHEVGAGGEHYGFDELSRIATNLGRMGAAQHVRTVDDFKSKFKETLDTLKKVSHDLGTSLEDAMKTIQSMKGSGIFKAADQARMAGDIRFTALAGGMAMSEVTGMASIGSQISRAIGGRGISGAHAGVRTIGQIGSATAVGALSEEDIYNATGLSGAEGRQALGAAQLQQSARFMSSSKGRYFLASIAGKNGQLDQTSVDEWMSGGNMETGRTAQMAHGNLAKVGRANFIRNEGRLRGEALSQFGGLAQSMALKQWLGSRGYDPSNMDDMSMLAFQRFTGMGRDEADVAIKQINHLPEIMQHQRDVQRGLGYADAQQRVRATTGIPGLEKKIDHWKEGVNSKFQTAGAGLLKAGSDSIEAMFNSAMGIHAEAPSDGLDDFSERIRHSTDAAAVRKEFRRTLGAGSRFDRPNEATLSNMAAGKALRAARAGAGSKMVNAGKASSDAVMMASIGAVFDPNDPHGADVALRQFQQNLPEDLRAKMIALGNRDAQFGMMQSLQEGAGVAPEHQVAAVLAKRQTAYGGSQFGAYSEAGRLEGNAAAMTGYTRGEDDRAFRDRRLFSNATALAGISGAVIGRALSGRGDLSTAAGRREALQFGVEHRHDGVDAVGRFLGRVGENLSGYTARREAIGGFLDNKDNASMVADMYSEDAGERKSGRRAMMDKILKMKEGGKSLSDAQKGEMDTAAAMLLATDDKFASMMRDLNEGKAAHPDLVAKMSSITGRKHTVEEMRQLAHIGVAGGPEALHRRQVELREKWRQKEEERINEDRTRLQASGGAVRNSDGSLTVTGHGEATGAIAEVDKELTAIVNMDASGDRSERMANLNKRIAGMSQEERKKLAIHGAGNEAGDAAARSLSAEKRLMGRAKHAGSLAGGVAETFGFDVDDDEKKALAKMDSEKQAKYLASKIGLTSEADVEKLKGALANKNKGEAAMSVEELKRGLTGKAKEDLQAREEGKRDPNVVQLEKIRENSDKQTAYLLKMSGNLPATAEDIKRATAGNAEDTK